MISLRKHIDGYRSPSPSSEPALDAFRSSLLAIAECSQRAVPALGGDLNEKLNGIAAGVDDARLLSKAAEEMRVELTAWADRALEHHNDNEREIREIIGAVAKTAESISEKGDRYAHEIGDLNTRLRSLAELHDMATIRRSILESTQALNTCVERMAIENKAAVAQLTQEVSEYRDRLEASEHASATDPLTGLANRRAFERKLEARIGARQRFCLIMLDMNGFKAVNDTHGHLAGDDLLKQFSAELKNQFSPADTVARWGGDEFTVIVAAPMQETLQRVEQVRRWALGEYKIKAVDPPAKVTADAAIGVVEWNSKEDAIQLVARADRAVYQAKTTSSRASRAPAAKSP